MPTHLQRTCRQLRDEKAVLPQPELEWKVPGALPRAVAASGFRLLMNTIRSEDVNSSRDSVPSFE